MASLPGRRASEQVRRSPQKANLRTSAFDVRLFLNSPGLSRKVETFRAKEIVITQGDPANNVIYIQEGAIKLTVVDAAGKEGIVGMIGRGDFCGEGCLAGQTVYMCTATAIAPTTVLVIDKDEMIRVLHDEHRFSDRFIAYLLSRSIRVEADLLDQLFNSTEKRLARTLLLLARYGAPGSHQRVLPKVSQETLAEMIGTSRTRVNLFMNKFKKLGYVRYNGEIRVNDSLLNVFLHD
jgi:CRP/FNR family cyclic AMP-dependent transcriptional regulator